MIPCYSKMERSIAPVECIEDSSSCSHINACGTENLWRRVDFAIRDVLGNTSLADLMREAEFATATAKMRASIQQHGELLPMAND